jgi:hypothetical protein
MSQPGLICQTRDLGHETVIKIEIEKKTIYKQGIIKRPKYILVNS